MFSRSFMTLSQLRSFVGVCLVALIGQAWLNYRLAMSEVAWVEPLEEGEKRNPEIFRLLSFGHLPSAIDWLFVKCLTDTTMNHVAQGKHSAFYYDLDLILEADPLYYDAYFVAGNLLTVIHHDGIGARELLTKGNLFIKEDLPHYPEDFHKNYWSTPWVIPVLLAYTSLFHLDDMAQAAEAFQQAALYPGVPEYVSHLSKRFKAPGGEYEVGLKLLNFLIDATKSEQARQVLAKKKRDLFVAQFLFELNHGFLEFLKTQRFYSASRTIDRKQMESYFREFSRRNQIATIDPWGGKVQLSPAGRIISTTPYESVFGLK